MRASVNFSVAVGNAEQFHVVELRRRRRVRARLDERGGIDGEQPFGQQFGWRFAAGDGCGGWIGRAAGLVRQLVSPRVWRGLRPRRAKPAARRTDRREIRFTAAPRGRRAACQSALIRRILRACRESAAAPCRSTTVALARFLIGKRLVHVTRRGRIAGRIVETEAYPPGDPTGYARPGLTTSNAPLFARARHGVRAHGVRHLPHAEHRRRRRGRRRGGPDPGARARRGHRAHARARPGVAPARPGARAGAAYARRSVSGASCPAWICARTSALWLERCAARRRGIQVTTRIGLSRDQHRRLRFVERGSPFVSVPP